MEKPETCPTCNRYTHTGLQQLAEQSKSLYGVDFSRPIEDLIEDVRKQLVQARGQLSDIGYRFTGWTERTKNVEGLLTCGLVALWQLKKEAEEHHKMWADKDAKTEIARS